jgi:hypothetical protein
MTDSWRCRGFRDYADAMRQRWAFGWRMRSCHLASDNMVDGTRSDSRTPKQDSGFLIGRESIVRSTEDPFAIVPLA